MPDRRRKKKNDKKKTKKKSKVDPLLCVYVCVSMCGCFVVGSHSSITLALDSYMDNYQKIDKLGEGCASCV